MKKYLISTSILFAVVTGVSAQEPATSVSVDTGTVQIKTMTAPAVGTRPASQAAQVTLTAVPVAMPTNVKTGTAVNVRAMPAGTTYQVDVMTTGDQAVDAKIRVIEEERAKKIQAINVEYDAKVKTAMGSLKPKAYNTTGASVSGQAGVMAMPEVTVTADEKGNTVYVNNAVDVQMVEGQPMPMDDRAHAAMTAEAQIAPTGIKGFFWKLFH